MFTFQVAKSAVYLIKARKFKIYLIFFRILVPFLQPGRLVSIKHGDKDFGFGSVVSFKKKTAKEKENPMEDCSYVIDVLIQVSEETSKSQSTLSLMPPAKNDKGVPIVVPIHPSLIQQISSVKLNMPRDIRSLDHRRIVQKSIGEFLRNLLKNSSKFVYILSTWRKTPFILTSFTNKKKS